MFPTRMFIRALSKSCSKLKIVKKFQQLHKKAFSDKYLLLTNVSISFSLSSVGDLLEQKYEIYSGNIEKWDKKRAVHMAISGATVGLICHYWYKILDKKMPGRTIKTVLLKVLLDQIICSPAYISVFFVTLAILEKKTFDELLEEVKEKAWILYAAEWVVWPIAQVINFYMVPPSYRVLYDNTISLALDVFTSKIKHSSKS